MEEDRGDRKCDDERHPHTFSAKAEGEGQIQAEGQGDTYIGEEGDTHGDAYILDTPQHGGSDTLQAVGVLEERTYHQQGRGNIRHLGVVGEDIRDPVAEEKHDTCAYRVHKKTEMDGGGGCHSHGVEVAFAELMGDTDGSSRSDALREHESEVTHLIGYMVRRKGFLADPADDDKRGGEEKSLRKRLQADRCTDRQQVLNLAAGDHPRTHGEDISAPICLPKHDGKETEGHERAGNEGSNAGTFGSHGFKAPMTEDEDPVKENIQEVARERDHHRDRGVAQSLEELLAETEKQERDD